MRAHVPINTLTAFITRPPACCALYSGDPQDNPASRTFDVLMDTFSLHEFMIRKVGCSADDMLCVVTMAYLACVVGCVCGCVCGYDGIPRVSIQLHLDEPGLHSAQSSRCACSCT